MSDSAKTEAFEALSAEIAGKALDLAKNLEMILPVLNKYADPKQCVSGLQKGGLVTMSGLLLLQILSEEITQSRELALALASTARVFMTEDEQNEIIATAEPIVAKYKAMKEELKS